MLGCVRMCAAVFCDVTFTRSSSVRLDFVYDLFERVNTWTGQDTVKCGSKYRRPTVSSQFKVKSSVIL